MNNWSATINYTAEREKAPRVPLAYQKPSDNLPLSTEDACLLDLDSHKAIVHLHIEDYKFIRVEGVIDHSYIPEEIGDRVTPGSPHEWHLDRLAVLLVEEYEDLQFDTKRLNLRNCADIITKANKAIEWTMMALPAKERAYA